MKKTPEQWIEEWTKLNEELIEDDCALTLNIPTVEQTKKWMKETEDYGNRLQ